MNCSTVYWCIGPFCHAIVAQYVGYAQPVVREYAVSALCLGLAMPLEVPPDTHRLFVAPERKRQVFTLCRQALEALNRQEPVNLLKIRLQRGRKVEVFLSSTFAGPDFKDHRNHCSLPSLASELWHEYERLCSSNAFAPI